MVAGVKDKAGTSMATVEKTEETVVAPSAAATKDSSTSAPVAYAPTSAPVVVAAATVTKTVQQQLPRANLVVPMPPSALADDLFSAHDFDVDIDLNVPGMGLVHFILLTK